MNPLKTVGVCLLIALALFAPCISAADNSTGNITVDNLTSITYPPNSVYRIMQGAPVWINDTIDISGMGWGSGIAWNGKYSDHDAPLYIYLFKDYQKKTLMNFYIDPQVFTSRSGMWYQYYGNTTEKNGNLAMFEVMATYRNNTLTFSNGTTINQSVGVSNVTPAKYPKPEILPENHVADYLLARGDPLTIDTPGGAQVWIFGRIDQKYVTTTENSITFDKAEFQNVEPGTYTILMQKPGNNTEYDVRYLNKSLQYRDGWNGIFLEDVAALQPRLLQGKLMELLHNTDDTYATYTLEIQEPVITITRLDEVGVGAKPYDFAFETGLITFMDTRGYTNLASGTTLTALLDGGDTYTKYSDTAFANRTSPGNMSIFQIYVPLIWDKISSGRMHTITVNGPLGTTVDAAFMVNEMPVDSYRPNGSLKYVGSQNPWVPTPTPITVPGPTQIVTQIVTVPVTPSEAVVYEQQRKAQGDVAASWIETGIAALVVLLIGYFGGGYLLSIWRRL